MAVCVDGQMAGSIGGGIMEHKFVEQAQAMLAQKTDQVYFRQQIHNKEATTNQSGMICSGEQWVAIYYLNAQRATSIFRLVEMLQKNKAVQLLLNEQSIFCQEEKTSKTRFHFHYEKDDKWAYTENIHARNLLYIIGGGHVGLAFSKLMAGLDFHIHIIDDREGLNTMVANSYADEKHYISYDKINQFLPEGDNVYVVLMTFGYRTDKFVLESILRKKFRYLGMMGAQAKVDQLFKELLESGISKEALELVHAPVGLPIASKTPEEIAISIAAEIIREKNCK